jgi:hypothetical protein
MAKSRRFLTCGIDAPKRNQDFACPSCTIPATIQWQNDHYINTCTSDNIMTIIHVYCQEHDNFLKYIVIGYSEAETSLKASLGCMLHGSGKESCWII